MKRFQSAQNRLLLTFNQNVLANSVEGFREPDGPGSGPDSHRTAEPRHIGTLRESDRTCPY